MLSIDEAVDKILDDLDEFSLVERLIIINKAREKLAMNNDTDVGC